jgi:hypothetical protein
MLQESCEPNCDNNQQLFKGVFARHLGYLIPYLTDAFHIKKYSSFLKSNTISLWTTSHCEVDELFSLFWNRNPSDACDSIENVVTTKLTSNWKLIGLGNCMDDNHD